MPTLVFECKKCKFCYEDLVDHDVTGKYKDVTCPECGSKRKNQLPTACNFIFAQPEGTKRFNNDHGYRFEHKKPSVIAQRENAMKKSHMGSNPYNNIDDTNDDKNFDFKNI